jgi:sortase A
MFERISPNPRRLALAGITFLLMVVGNHPAMATSEQNTGDNPQAINTISLDGFTPDKSEWSEKQTRKYEAVKDSGGDPLAMLKVERLNLEAPVYFGTDRITLDRGVGIVEGTANLGEVGNIGISGHRDGFFRPLKDIRVGDRIEMQTLNGIQNFEVSDISIVDALDISVLDPTDTTVLTLITCHPFYYVGYAPDRYIVRATPVDDEMNNGKKNPLQEATKQASSGIQ